MGSSVRSSAFRAALGAALALGAAARLGAQPRAVPASPRATGAPAATIPDGSPAAAPRLPARAVAGRVVRPGAGSLLPTPNIWVTLHRVAPDGAGPLDSTRTDADGAYRFAYQPFGSDDAVYFVSARYGGIAYFASPLGDGAVTGEAAEITVFDTTSAPLPLTVRGRHLIVAAPGESGARMVTEVYELSNDSTVTAVARDSGATFTAVVPGPAVDPRVGPGDVAGEAVRFAPGRVEVSAPFAPGLKQLTLVYTLPREHFPLSIPVERGAQVLEVLVEDPTGTATGAGLTAVDPATVSGRTFRRFLAQNVPANAIARIDVPAPRTPLRRFYLTIVAAVIAAAMLAALARALARRRSSTAAVRPAGPTARPAPRAEAIAREIAALDTAFEQDPEPTPEARTAYAERRAALKAELTAALAGEQAGVGV